MSESVRVRWSEAEVRSIWASLLREHRAEQRARAFFLDLHRSRRTADRHAVSVVAGVPDCRLRDRERER